jgi:hypothetical protein
MSDAETSHREQEARDNSSDWTAVADDPPASEYSVPEGAAAYECAYCGRPFAREEWLALHRGLDHPGLVDDAEAEAFREAYGDEQDELGQFRLKALGALILVYFGLLLIYAVV